jgi:Flp pilus assembly protein TadB
VTVSPGEDEGSSQQDNELVPAADGSPAATSDGWRGEPSDEDVDAAFAAIVARFAVDPRWNSATDSVAAPEVQQHPIAGPQAPETGAERARRRELRRLERAAEVAAFAAHEAEVQAERDADEAHFTPPEPPPLPRPKGRTIAAILLIVAGLCLLAKPSVLAVGVELTMVIAVAMILGGAYLLLSGIWRRRAAGDDGSDDGAVV